MKRLILVSAVWFLICLCARAGDSDDNPFNASLLDGRIWLTMSTPGKLMHLRAASDVVQIAQALIFAQAQQDQKPLSKEIIDTLDAFKLPEVSYGEGIAALDTLYANPSNIRIPILLTFKWMKLKGEKERDTEAARLRAGYPKDGK